ncbi:hypothetical protein [Clostridioides difficile]|nr:hypothetical protein [Clostridioides difficile]MDC9467585.1 hypothetical protein [Clostridioides difficile]
MIQLQYNATIDIVSATKNDIYKVDINKALVLCLSFKAFLFATRHTNSCS